MPSSDTQPDTATLSTPSPAATVYLRNRVAVLAAERAAETWLQSLWRKTEEELQARIPASEFAGWRIERQSTERVPTHGVGLVTRDLLPDVRRHALAGTTGVNLKALAFDARARPEVPGTTVRIELYFSSVPAFRAIANASAAVGSQGPAFQSELARIRAQSGKRTEGDVWLGLWDVQLEMGPVDPSKLAQLLVGHATRAWDGLLAPLFGGPTR